MLDTPFFFYAAGIPSCLMLKFNTQWIRFYSSGHLHLLLFHFNQSILSDLLLGFCLLNFSLNSSLMILILTSTFGKSGALLL